MSSAQAVSSAGSSARAAPVRAAGPLDRRLIDAVPIVRQMLAVSVALGLVATAAVVVQAVALAHLVASAMPGAAPTDRFCDFAWLGGAVALRALVAFVAEPVSRLGAESAKADLRGRLLLAVVARTPAGEGSAPGDVATLAGRGLDALDVYLGRCVPDLVLAVVAPIATLAAVGVLDWLSALVLLVAVGLFPLFGALVGRASRTLAAERWRQVEDLGGTVNDVFSGLAVLRAFGRAADQRRRLAQAGEALRDASMATLRVAFLSALVLDTLASISVALVAVPLGLRLLDGGVSLPAALAVLVIAPEVLLPLRRASAEFHESTEGLAAAARALPLAGTDDASKPARRRLPVPDLAVAPVELRAVCVDVAGRDAPILEDVSLTIAPGETVALVGANGAGKSSIAHLLLGFLAPSRGSVGVGGTDLGDVDLEEWRRRITYLPSHPVVVAGSLADNLRLGNRDATDEQLLWSLQAAGAPELVASLPDGLATRIGDGGRPISAGERQRIAIARTLLRPASLYILDEPTVHLDGRSKATAVASLHELLAGRSALVVTHDPVLRAFADRVVTIDAGRIVRAERTGPSTAAPVGAFEAALAAAAGSAGAAGAAG